ncbi:unnamed protein product [Diatraea saccharalis]|uniref:G-protein coupled receptors family 1 profile domain-containing protein n=1 Tax=Diatraea saccharalis TaxID=40085 RepID=A0A9N9R6Z0_9NEOP|nr:unnamed protein product [Diatraea saccharalis]
MEGFDKKATPGREIGWKYTNAWLVGNLSCKLLLVVRAFGLYLSSNILVCISIDRFFAVLYPLRVPAARRRSQQMLYCAWAAALACSLPQVRLSLHYSIQQHIKLHNPILFKVKRHPRVAGFEQCVSFDAFSNERQEVAYTVFCLCAMYFVPLVVITVCYVCIFCEIRRSSKELVEKCIEHGIAHVRLRRSGRRVLQRARRRTLRMTVTIVSVFALCWLPYMIDRPSAARVSVRVQDLLFAMAVSNSCMNPLVYGSYTLHVRAPLKRLWRRACCRSSAASDTIGS